jgi:glycosyltransferase involved in cell wall biosynthesis
MRNKPLVSVVITTKNSSKTLERVLQSIKKQTWDNIEIIIVDNYSCDETLNIAKRYTDKVFLKGPERSAQANYGVKKSKGKYILRLGADVVIFPKSVEFLVNIAEKYKADAIIFRSFSIGKSYWAKCRTFERFSYYGHIMYEAPRFFDRRAIIEIGGYDESLIACEDYDVCKRMLDKGYKIVRVPFLVEAHFEEGNLPYYVRRGFYYGKSILRYIKKHKTFAFKQLAPIRHTFFNKNMLSHPQYFLGIIFLRVITYISAFLGIISALIYGK